MIDPIDAAADGLARETLLRRERIPAVLVNTMMSIAFFFLIFGWGPAGSSALAIDFVPQTLGISLLGGIVPALIMRRRIATGGVIPAGPVPTLAALLVKIVACVVVALVVAAGLAAALTILLAPPLVPPLPAILLKAAYGGLLGLIMTPPVLRMTLGMPAFGTGRGGAAVPA